MFFFFFFFFIICAYQFYNVSCARCFYNARVIPQFLQFFATIRKFTADCASRAERRAMIIESSLQSRDDEPSDSLPSWPRWNFHSSSVFSRVTDFTRRINVRVQLVLSLCDLIRVHLVLAKLGIVHFLCLGGLWGQVRIGRALPWARKVELCLVDTLRDDVLITKAFREVGLSATYLHAAGVYRIQEHEVGEDAPKVEVVVFEKDAVVSLITKLVISTLRNVTTLRTRWYLL